MENIKKDTNTGGGTDKVWFLDEDKGNCESANLQNTFEKELLTKLNTIIDLLEVLVEDNKH